MSTTHYRRRLPHIMPPGETIFVTFRLAGSVPQAALAQWRAEQLRQGAQPTYGQTDTWLDSQPPHGPDWLHRPDVARQVADALHYRHPTGYYLWAYCIMPNHVHFVASLPADAPPLRATLQSLKARTARQCNQLIGQTGAFWQDESYDHVVRTGEEMGRVVRYILNNPVKARLTDSWEKWPFTYLNPEW